MQGHLTRFPHIDAVFAINDPQAIGADLAAQAAQPHAASSSSRSTARRTSRRRSRAGQPDQASASQDPYEIAVKATELGAQIVEGQKPAQTMIHCSTRKLITRQNVGELQGLDRAALNRGRITPGPGLPVPAPALVGGRWRVGPYRRRGDSWRAGLIHEPRQLGLGDEVIERGCCDQHVAGVDARRDRLAFGHRDGGLDPQ